MSDKNLVELTNSMTAMYLTAATEKLTKEKDDLIYKALERFGITRDNVFDYVGRLAMCTHYDGERGITYEQYMLDHRPIFTVMTWSEPNPDEYWKMTFKIKIEFVEEVKND